MIPYGRQDISEQDIQAVVDVLRSDRLTQGPAIAQFETTVSTYCHATHAVAVCNATAALHLACRGLDLGPGDVLWTTPNTFVASANCARYCGASVDFVDIDSRTYNMNVDALLAKLESAERGGRLPKIVVPVHFAGQSCEMREIKTLADRFGFHIIEDASHAIGGRYLADPVGSCRYSDIAVFSFHPVKIVTTGEGGMALTNKPDLAEKLRLLASHGVTHDRAHMVGESDGDWTYQQIELGYNYRITDILAALGISQMTRLDGFVRRRHEIAARYDDAFHALPITPPWQHEDAYSSRHLYPIRVSERGNSNRRQEIFGALRAAGISVNVHYIPVHTQPYYRNLGFKDGDYPAAEHHYRETISLPIFAALTEAQQSTVIETIEGLMR